MEGARELVDEFVQKFNKKYAQLQRTKSPTKIKKLKAQITDIQNSMEEYNRLFKKIQQMHLNCILEDRDSSDNSSDSSGDSDELESSDLCCDAQH